ncbi:hypothetical protein AJ78_03465 [Emergomyces pasteurianus Ep9510]|uniref:Uncharacterized protein n=1 Tax=Emergomyces pasteurianus Ep9510 TaxID=1447872 RepID=A0A1J9PJZ3_9EURO|nr:hypothetical protein AJ78_03465 [Emergomyces pasteurianus Ep9510]
MHSMGKRRPSQKGVSEGGRENAQGTLPRLSPNETKNKSRRYEIRTLLDIGRRLGATSDSSVYSTKSIDVASLSHHREESGGRVLTEKPVNRHRISSSFSISNEDGLLLSQANNVQYPRRQPLNAPQGNLAQSDAGFARFLKEHASPKHHRVTAGGRIVPMNLASSPAPEFKLPAKTPDQFQVRKLNNSYLQNRSTDRCTDFREGESLQQRRVHVKSDRSKPVGFSFLVPRKTSGSDSGEIHTLPHTVPNALGRETSGQEAQQQPNGSLNTHPVKRDTIGQQIPESTSVSSGYTVPNVGFNLAGWVPNDTLQYHVSSPTGQSFPLTYTTQQGAILGMYPVDQSGLMMAAPTPLFQVPTLPINHTLIQHAQISHLGMASAGLSEEPLNHKSLEKAAQEYDKLTDQLSNLDRYLAIHSWDIDPLAKKILIDQRVELVMKLDAARSTKEQIEAAIQFLASRATNEEQSLGHPQFSNDVCGQATSWPSNIGQYTNNGFLGNLDPTECLMHGIGLSTAESFNSTLSEQTRPPFTSTAPVNNFEGCQTTNGFNLASNMAHDWTANANLTFDNSYTIFSGGQSRGIQSAGRESVFEGASETARECAPPEISRVYHDIETAAGRGEPLGPLIEELAMVARKLNIADITKNRDLVMRSEKASQRIDSNEKQLAVVPFNGGTTNGSSSNKSNHTRSTTTDSQVTSLESMKHNSEIRTPGKNCEALSQTTAGKVKNSSKHKGDDKDIQYRNNKSRAKNVEPNEEQIQAYDGVSGVSGSSVLYEGNCERHKKESIREQYSLGKPASQNAPRSNEIPFSPWKQAGQNSGLPRKANTSTASHNVNAYGFVPRFDGAGDPDGTDPKPASVVLNFVAASGVDTTRATGEKWYRKTPRKNPDPMDVRAFFKHLREQEQVLIRQHRKDGRPFG